MTDPANMDDYNAKAMQSHHIEGYGVDVVSYMPCPGCAAPDWLAMPITAALEGYESVAGPRACGECGRSFELVINDDGNGTMTSHFSFVAGPDMPEYLDIIASDDRGV